MINVPSNSEIESLKPVLKKNLKIESRISLDSNPFATLETIKFQNLEKEYVLKSVVPILKTEVIVHEKINSYNINAAKILASDMNNLKIQYFILMEKIKFTPIYQIPPDEAIDYYFDIADKLGHFHLKNVKNVKEFRNKGIKIFGPEKYLHIIDGIGKRINKYSNNTKHEYLLTKELVEKFDYYIDTLRIMFKPFSKDSKFTLVHGDFDSGNLIINNENKNIFAIDWGLAHIDLPMIDMAHLLNATDLKIDIRREIFEKYYLIAEKLYPNDLSMQDVRNIGKVMHILYFIDWFMYATENNFVDELYFLEQIHNRVQLLTDLLTDPHDE